MTIRCPVCNREVDALRARAVSIWGGRTFYFCTPEHKEAFARDPAAQQRAAGVVGRRERAGARLRGYSSSRPGKYDG